MALQPFGLRHLFQILNPIHSRTPWTGDQPVARALPTHRTTQTQNKRTETSMLLVEFEPTTPVSEQAKTIHALHCAATVIGLKIGSQNIIRVIKWKGMRWTRHPACMRDTINARKILFSRSKVTNHLLDRDINRKTILKRLLRIESAGYWFSDGGVQCPVES
jgi:hypothetical protein